MKNIRKMDKLRLANTSSDAKLELKEEEILEKKLLEILENYNFEEEEEGFCPSRFTENGVTPD
jgi:signal transduction histidine kinase